MKMNHLNQSMLVLCLLLFISCQQEEPTTENDTQSFTEDVFAKNWQEADLSTIFTGQEMNYPIGTQQLKNVMNHTDVYQIRFVPGVLEGKLEVKVISVDAKGMVLAEELVRQTETLEISSQLTDLATVTVDKAMSADPIVSKHILQFHAAANYLTSWKQKSALDINEVTSYNEIRIRHFSMEPAVVAHMIALGADFINLSWGLNPEHKLTTVFVPVTNNQIHTATKNGSSGSAFDFSFPCPPLCGGGGGGGDSDKS